MWSGNHKNLIVHHTAHQIIYTSGRNLAIVYCALTYTLICVFHLYRFWLTKKMKRSRCTVTFWTPCRVQHVQYVHVKGGRATRTRYISISNVSAALGHDVCASLLGLHSFTGCDTVSAFSGRGKLAALKLVMTNDHFRDAFIKLGAEWQLTEEILKVRLYVIHSEICDVNEMRYELFRVKDGNVESEHRNCPPARIVSIYMLRGPTTRLPSGNARCRQTHMYQVHLSAKVGHWAIKENSS